MKDMKKMMGGYLVLLVYFLGIGFISGSIVHFTLNPWRFGMLGIVGGILFGIATYIKDFGGEEGEAIGWKEILYKVSIGVFLSIGLGMISGSIQHFDEVTFEALRYIPIGTALSLAAWWLQEKDLRHAIKGAHWAGVVVGGTLLSIVVGTTVQKAFYPHGPVDGHHDSGETTHHGKATDDHKLPVVDKNTPRVNSDEGVVVPDTQADGDHLHDDSHPH